MRHIIILLLLTACLSGCDYARYKVQKKQCESALSKAKGENNDLYFQLDTLETDLQKVENERDDALHNQFKDERKVAYYYWCKSVGNLLKICPNNLSFDGVLAHNEGRKPSWLWLAIYFLTTLLVIVIVPVLLVNIIGYPFLKLQESLTEIAISQLKKKEDDMTEREKEVLENVSFINHFNSNLNENKRKAKKLNQEIKELAKQEESLMQAIKKHEEDIEKLQRLNDSFKKL